MEWNYLLIGVLAIILVGMMYGYRKGFLRVVISLFGIIAVLIISVKVTPKVNDYVLDRTSSYETVRGTLIEKYHDLTNTDKSVDTKESQEIGKYTIPKQLETEIVKNTTEDIYTKLTDTLFEEFIAGFLAKVIIRIGVFLGIFLLLNIILVILQFSAKVLEKIPVLRTFNKLLGMVCGLSVSLMAVWTFFLCTFVFVGSKWTMWVLTEVSRSRILTYLFDNNIFFKILHIG